MKQATRLSGGILAAWLTALSLFVPVGSALAQSPYFWNRKTAQGADNKADFITAITSEQTASTVKEDVLEKAQQHGLLATYGAPDEQAPVSQEDRENLDAEKNEIKESLRLMQENGLWDAARYASATAQTPLLRALLRIHFETRGGKVLDNKDSTALGGTQIVNETSAGMMRSVGSAVLESLKEKDPSIVPSFAYALTYINGLSAKKFAAFCDNIRKARTADQAKNIPPDVFNALKDIRLNHTAALLLDQTFNKMSVKNIREWMGAYTHPDLPDELLEIHNAQFGPTGVRRLIHAFQKTPDKKMIRLFPFILGINSIDGKQTVGAYVHKMAQDYRRSAQAIKIVYTKIAPNPMVASSDNGPVRRAAKGDPAPQRMPRGPDIKQLYALRR